MSDSYPASPISASGVNLTNCDREPIHIPGSVQPHGVLLVVREPEMTIIQASANSASLLGRPAENLCGTLLRDFVQPMHFRYWEQQVLLKRLDANPLFLTPFQVAGCETLWEATIHRHDGVLLLQLEPTFDSGATHSVDLFSDVRSALVELERTSSVNEFCQVAAERVRDFIGYDRVVVYRLLEDGSGAVIAEAKEDSLESWLGLHYPASDIPKQARALYEKSWLRIISDVDAVTSPVMPALNPLTGAPLDMSYCVLRSVSPIHIQYLKNIGAQASMSMSILKAGRLWGLVACHHRQPRQVPHSARIACEFLAHVLSLQMSAKEDAEHYEYRLRMKQSVHKVVERMASERMFDEGSVWHDVVALSLFDSSTVAVVLQNSVARSAGAPSEDRLRELAEWLSTSHPDEEVFSTNSLSQLFTPAQEYRSSASGLLAVRLSRYRSDYIFWFRPEETQIVNWAGNPNKPVEETAEGMQLGPRRSFALWKETVHGRSLPWHPAELQAAAEFRRSILEIILRKADELAQMNRALHQSNIELDSFAYIASHDLKEPLRGIHNYSNLVMRSSKDKLSPSEQDRLQSIVRLTQRMDDLLDALLKYSRVGRADIVRVETDLQDLLKRTLDVLRPRIEQKRTAIHIPRDLPRYPCDRVLVSEVFANLISNAIKYNDKPDPWVEIGFIEKAVPVFYVRDNGIGIEPKHHEQVFQIFRRLHERDEYGGGTGAGLTIARKTVERHGGSLWLQSEPGHGSAFYFTLEPSENHPDE